MVYPGNQRDILQQVAAGLQEQGNTIHAKGQVFPYDPKRCIFREEGVHAGRVEVLTVVGTTISRSLHEIVVPTTVSTSVAVWCAVIAAADLKASPKNLLGR